MNSRGTSQRQRRIHLAYTATVAQMDLLQFDLECAFRRSTLWANLVTSTITPRTIKESDLEAG